jgi:hypothetical protein
MKKGAPFLYGTMSALLSWGILTLADGFDELVLGCNTFVGSIVFCALPVLMLIKYIVHCIRKRPVWKRLLAWFAGYSAVFLPVWLYVCSVDEDKFLIPQNRSESGFDFNGIEYLAYGFTAYCAFIAACIVFHIVFAIMKAAKKNKIGKNCNRRQ